MLKNIRNEKSMQVDQLAQYIGFDTTPSSWKIAYKEIKNNIPQNIKWLDKQYVLSVLKYYKLNDMSFIKKYLETIEMINSNFYLRQICYLWHYILYIDNSNLYKDVWKWKRNENLFKNAGSDMMPVVVLLSGYEKHLQNMKERKYDNEQIEEQIRNINECCTLDKQRFNIDGIRFSQMVWGSYFINGKLIQVGRLQYEIVEKVPTEVRKFKDGNYIYIHIPRGKNLDIEEVEKSIKLAKEKIQKFYPEIDISKLRYYTNTWLLSNELDNILDVNSNILKFKNKFSIIEQTEKLDDFLNFVFQEKDTDVKLEDLKEETTLQKKLKEYLLEGHKLHIGLGVLKD